MNPIEKLVSKAYNYNKKDKKMSEVRLIYVMSSILEIERPNKCKEIVNKLEDNQIIVRKKDNIILNYEYIYEERDIHDCSINKKDLLDKINEKEIKEPRNQFEEEINKICKVKNISKKEVVKKFNSKKLNSEDDKNNLSILRSIYNI